MSIAQYDLVLSRQGEACVGNRSSFGREVGGASSVHAAWDAE